MSKKNNVTLKSDPMGKKALKELSAELDMSIIELTRNFSTYKKELGELLKKRR